MVYQGIVAQDQFGPERSHMKLKMMVHFPQYQKCTLHFI